MKTDEAAAAAADESPPVPARRRSSRIKKTPAAAAAAASTTEEETTSTAAASSSSSSAAATANTNKRKKQTAATTTTTTQKKTKTATKGASSSLSKKKSSSSSKANEDSDDASSSSSSSSSPTKKRAKTVAKKKKAPKHQVLTERDALPKLWDEEKAAANGSYTFKVATWNVAGLRALVKKMPNALAELCQRHDLDVLCLQETKLQEQHLDDPKLKLRGHLLHEEGYEAYYSCSTVKKGYAGTAVFVRRRQDKADLSKNTKQTTLGDFFPSKKEKKTSTETANDDDDDDDDDDQSSQKPAASTGRPLPAGVEASWLCPQQVSYKLGKEEHDGEGRVIAVDFPLFTLINVYVPNSGQTLQRLSYRTDEWDKDLVAFCQQKQTDNNNIPVVWLGDLNVAHTNLEVWNDGAKHLAKQAGVTAEERASFQQQLDDSGFIDAFRHLHPTAKGHYSYWSQRAGNREPNKGLRLDYFICDPVLFDESFTASKKVVVRDSYLDVGQMGSDHCPAILELEIKP